VKIKIMSSVLKYLKGSVTLIIIVIALLMVKVGTDLVLPLYTSKIVNVGIEQQGISSLVPHSLSKETYQKLHLAASETEKSQLQESYTLADGNYLLKENYSVNEDMMVSLLTDSETSFAKQKALQMIAKEYRQLGLNTKSIQTKYILSVGLKMLLISFLGMGSLILVSFFASKVAAALGKNLRSAIYKKTLYFNQEEMEKFSSASLVTRSTNDIQQIQQSFVMILRVVVFAPLMALGGLFSVLKTNIGISWIIGLAILAIFTVVMTMFVLAMPRFKKLQLLIDSINRIVRETLTGLPVIRAFNTQEYEKERFEKANRELTSTSLFINRVMSGMMPLMNLIMNLTAVLIVWQSSYQIEANLMQVGDMMAFIQYTMLIIMSFLMITMLTIVLPRAAVSATRIKEVLETPINISDPKEPKVLKTDNEATVTFDNVSFAYPGSKEPTLCEISFSAKKGSTVAVIGSTGSGKSTLVNLIPRFYDVTGGTISLNGTDIRDLELFSLRKSIGYIPQRGFLFSGTIESNLKFAKDNLDEKEIEKSASIAEAVNFIKEKEGDYKSQISQGGTNVSGGQRQRLAIARAIASNPPILIFDDSFSALDFKTESKIRANIAKELKDTTLFIVAQRVSSITDADEILVLDEGRLVGKGKHKELMKNCKVYQEIAASQLTQKELNGYER